MGDHPKPQPHPQETVSLDPLTVSQNDHDNAVNAPNVTPIISDSPVLHLCFYA